MKIMKKSSLLTLLLYLKIKHRNVLFVKRLIRSTSAPNAKFSTVQFSTINLTICSAQKGSSKSKLKASSKQLKQALNRRKQWLSYLKTINNSFNRIEMRSIKKQKWIKLNKKDWISFYKWLKENRKLNWAKTKVNVSKDTSKNCNMLHKLNKGCKSDKIA